MNDNDDAVSSLTEWKNKKERSAENQNRSTDSNSPPFFDSAFGDRLTRFISEADLTPAKLAAIIEVPSEKVELYTHGQIPESLVLHKIAIELEVTMEELLTGKVNVKKITELTLQHFAKELRNRRRAEKLNALIDKKRKRYLKWYVLSAAVSSVVWFLIQTSNFPQFVKVVLGNIISYGVLMTSLGLIFFDRAKTTKFLRSIKNMFEL